MNKLLEAAKKAREALRHSVSATCGEAQEFGGDLTDRIAFDALDAAIEEAEKTGDKVQVTPQGFQINIPIVIPRQRIADVLCSAFESGNYGSGYWASIGASYGVPDGAVPHDKNSGWYMVDGEGYPKYASLPLIGGNITVHARDDEIDDGRHVLDEAAIKRGLSVLAIKHLNDILEENDDGDTADIFLQCCLFGEVVYG